MLQAIFIITYTIYLFLFIVENIKHLFSTVMNSNVVRVVVVMIVWKLYLLTSYASSAYHH
jgi:hypothetical protein